jgi:uncharacterized protein (TIGR03083 family)
MDLEGVWRHVHDERRALATLLGTLDEAAWGTPSICAGWTVKDVAAHVIHSPQYRMRDFIRMMVTARFDINRAILVDGQRLGRAPVADILEQFETYDGSRAVPPTTTPFEPLIDVLVHTQDIVRPLGMAHAMPVDAARAATERVLEKPQKVFAPAHLDGVRLVATDTDWEHGRGPTVRAPMQEILLLTTGRRCDPDLVEGDVAFLSAD